MDDPCCAYLRLIQPVLEYLQRQNTGGGAEAGEESTTFSAETVAAAAMAIALLHFGLSSAWHYASRRRDDGATKKSPS